MRKKIPFFICSIIIIVSNIIMITVANNGEDIFSNIFVIGITVFLFPGFLWAINNQKTASIRLESSALLMLAVISIIRLINRIAPLPPIANATVIIIAIGLGTALAICASIRIFKKKKDQDD